MQNKQKIFIFYLLLLPLQVFAQSWEYGTNFNSLSVTGHTYTDGRLVEAKGNTTYWGLNFGGNLPLYRVSKEFEFGLLAVLDVGQSMSSSVSNGGPNDGFCATLPVYLTYKFGADFNKVSKFPVGFGIGYGFQYLGYIMKGSDDNEEDNGVYGFLNPSIAFETVIMPINLKIRIEKPLGAMKRSYQTNQPAYIGSTGTSTLDYGYDFKQVKLSLLWRIKKKKLSYRF